MISRRSMLAAAAGFTFLVAGMPALAAEKYSSAAVEAAQKAGKSVLVEISAPWCPTCKAQRPIIDNLAGSDKYKGFSYFTVDFDTQKDVVKKLNARSQSTLIVYKGEAEVGRSVGDTDPAKIEGLLAKAL
ncbi:MAG: thioredoxin family protein [Hyphomicrobiaceae bacterium]